MELVCSCLTATNTLRGTCRSDDTFPMSVFRFEATITRSGKRNNFVFPMDKFSIFRRGERIGRLESLCCLMIILPPDT